MGLTLGATSTSRACARMGDGGGVTLADSGCHACARHNCAQVLGTAWPNRLANYGGTCLRLHQRWHIHMQSALHGRWADGVCPAQQRGLPVGATNKRAALLGPSKP